jgi:sulfite exporter TauE/SafE
MDNIIVASFLTGLTAGGLSCFAVQGGLLSGSISRQVEMAKATLNKQGKSSSVSAASNKGIALSVLLFLAAKLTAYTILGFVLGWLGSVFYLSPMLKGMIQIGIGLFLVGNALRMFNVHPFFRHFNFEPPSSWTRFVRRASKGNDRLATPLFLGTLTILIPCGVTQSAMAVAVGTGNPLMGAAILFAFILGTSPTFFGVTVLAGGLAKIFQKYFYPIVAVIILGLGLYSVNGGLNLIGSPLAPARMLGLNSPEAGPPVAAADSSSTVPLSSTIRINVLNSGYKPSFLTAPANQPIRLVMVTNNVRSCSRDFVIPDLNLSQLLPATGETVLEIPSQQAGSSLQFMCSMGMYTGVIQFR